MECARDSLTLVASGSLNPVVLGKLLLSVLDMRWNERLHEGAFHAHVLERGER